MTEAFRALFCDWSIMGGVDGPAWGTPNHFRDTTRDQAIGYCTYQCDISQLRETWIKTGRDILYGTKSIDRW